MHTELNNKKIKTESESEDDQKFYQIKFWMMKKFMPVISAMKVLMLRKK